MRKLTRHSLLLGDTPESLLEREAAGQFVAVAQPATRTTAAAHALRLAEAAGLEIARAESRLLMHCQMRPPRAQGADSFNCGALHGRVSVWCGDDRPKESKDALDS